MDGDLFENEHRVGKLQLRPEGRRFARGCETRPLAETKDALEFEFEDLKPTSTAVTLKWEKLGVPFTVSVNDADQTLQNIRAQMKGAGQFAWQAPDQAAQFCLTKKINLDEALRWADLSIQNEERFENLSTKADILKALNKPDEAKTTWNKALEKADAPQLYTYGRQLQNQKKGAEAMEIFKEVAKRFPTRSVWISGSSPH